MLARYVAVAIDHANPDGKPPIALDRGNPRLSLLSPWKCGRPAD
jgi:hypothetical protein